MVISPHTQVTCEDQIVVAGPLGSAIMGRQSLDNLRHWCAILCRSQQLIRWHLTSSGCTLKNIGEDWSRIMDDVLEGSSCDSRVPRYTLEGGIITLQIGCTELASCSGSRHGCMETYQKYIDICLPINASTSSTDDKLPVLSYHLTILTD